MALEDDQVIKIRHRILYAVYGIAAIGFAFAVWRGWFTANSHFTTEVAPATILLLIFATYLVRGTSSVLRAAAGPPQRAIWDLLKGIACFLGSFAWIIALAKRAPDTPFGAALLFGPSLGAILFGGFYFWRASGFVTGRVMRVLLVPKTTEYMSSDRGQALSSSLNPESDRIEIPINYRKLLVRFVLSVLAMIAVWWLMGRGNVFFETLDAVGIAYISYLHCRIAFGRGPGLIMSPSGISVRRHLGLLAELPWSQATTVEVKSTKLFSCLVVGVRYPERLIESANGYQRWAMRQNLDRFGSPMVVFAMFLKCDLAWLRNTAKSYRDRYGGT